MLSNWPPDLPKDVFVGREVTGVRFEPDVTIVFDGEVTLRCKDSIIHESKCGIFRFSQQTAPITTNALPAILNSTVSKMEVMTSNDEMFDALSLWMSSGERLVILVTMGSESYHILKDDREYYM